MVPVSKSCDLGKSFWSCSTGFSSKCPYVKKIGCFLDFCDMTIIILVLVRKSCFSRNLSETFRNEAYWCKMILSRVMAPLMRQNRQIHFVQDWNYWWEIDQTWPKCSLGGPLSKLLKWSNSIENFGCHGNKNEKNMKT